MKRHFLLSLFFLTPFLCPAQTLEANADSSAADIPTPHAALSSATLPKALSVRSPLIVIGFAGGFIRHTSSVHGEVALALHLAKKYGTAIHSEIFENHRGDDAHREILRLIAAQNPAADSTLHQPSSFAAAGTPAADSTSTPRIILYGHSWGASEAVNVARQLQRDGIPVLLLVSVDGVRKRQQDDGMVPANVAQAINFYQTEGLLHGRSAIHAADPAATQIIDNVHLSYKDNDIPTPGYPWIARTFTHRHIEIENDPRVWNQVEAMILQNLPPSSLSPPAPPQSPLLNSQ